MSETRTINVAVENEPVIISLPPAIPGARIVIRHDGTKVTLQGVGNWDVESRDNEIIISEPIGR